MLGNYLSAATLWQDRAIPQGPRSTAAAGLSTRPRVLIRGEAIQATDTVPDAPGHPEPSKQAGSSTWRCASSRPACPTSAATHFTKALTLAPDLAVRPIAAYYLQKMGKPVPEAAKNPAQGAVTVPPASPEPTKPSTASTERHRG